MRIVFTALGAFTCIALGMIGAIVPGLPTTIFLICAAFLFEKSWPRGREWLMNHSTFGPPLTAWKEHGAISMRGKLAATSGMLLGIGMILILNIPFWVKVSIIIFILASMVFVVSRPRANV